MAPRGLTFQTPATCSLIQLALENVQKQRLHIMSSQPDPPLVCLQRGSFFTASLILTFQVMPTLIHHALLWKICFYFLQNLVVMRRLLSGPPEIIFPPGWTRPVLSTSALRTSGHDHLGGSLLNLLQFVDVFLILGQNSMHFILDLV